MAAATCSTWQASAAASHSSVKGIARPSAIKEGRQAAAQGAGRRWPDRDGTGTRRVAAAAQASAAPSSAARADMQRADSDLSGALSLGNIRQTLIRLEDTIIFALIERAQFAHNAIIYRPDGIPVPGFRRDGTRYSLLEYLLRDIEQVHGRIRRYTSPDEHPYYPEDLPPLVLPPMVYPQVLAPGTEDININDQIMEMYLEHLLPEITQPGDDGNYGSSAMDDVMVLQALSKRIHYGKYVAEAKFRSYTEEYTALIKAGDAQGILDLLTDRAVELKVIERVKLKAATFGQDLSAGPVAGDGGSSSSSGGAQYKVRPEVVAQLYEDWVMPLTKEVEVQYLMRRLDGQK